MLDDLWIDPAFRGHGLGRRLGFTPKGTVLLVRAPDAPLGCAT